MYMRHWSLSFCIQRYGFSNKLNFDLLESQRRLGIIILYATPSQPLEPVLKKKINNSSPEWNQEDMKMKQ